MAVAEWTGGERIGADRIGMVETKAAERNNHLEIMDYINGPQKKDEDQA
jgi:hypothetical protein